MVQLLRALITLAQDQVLIPSIYMMAHNYM